MGYADELTFAKRTCEIYFETRGKDICKEYEYTHALGCLLNIISTIRPDNDFIVDISDVIPGKTEAEIKDVLVVIRDGLAHHTSANNFCEITENQISSIRLAHHKGHNKTDKMTYENLDQLIQKLHEKIKEELSRLGKL